MINFFRRLVMRLKVMRHTVLAGDKSRLLFHKNVNIELGKGSQIEIGNGTFQIGFTLPSIPLHASYPQTMIHLGENSRLTIEGDAFLAPGATIRIKDNAHVVFRGNNTIAHNFTLLTAKYCEIGFNTTISWNVTMIDDDGHHCRSKAGRILKGLASPLVISDHVGIQMHVTIPRGINVGSKSIISAGTTVRQDVPAECHVYQGTKLTYKPGRMMDVRNEQQG